MAKTVKMVIYGKAGTGKSTFVSKAPNPFYICTDSNFEWLDLPKKNHVKVSSWNEAKKVIQDIVSNKPEYKEFQTIAVDLIETLYVWAEDEFCKKQGIIHIGDYKSMGAGYNIVRKEFFATISKLLSIDKHVVLISHEADKVGKTKAGADEFMYIPSDKLSLSKMWYDIEGEVRFFLRCFTEDQEENGRMRTKRYLSLIPGKGEFGISRCADEDNWPREIPLDWKIFSDIIGLEKTQTIKEVETIEEVKLVTPPKPIKKVAKKPEAEKVEPIIETGEEVVSETKKEIMEDCTELEEKEEIVVSVPETKPEVQKEEVSSMGDTPNQKILSAKERMEAYKRKIEEMKNKNN